MGHLKDEGNSYLEFNILVLKKNQICRVMYFSDYCGEQLFSNYPADLKVVLDTFHFNTPIKLDTFYFEIPFQKNKSNYNYIDFAPMIEALQNKNYIIHQAEIKAFSSVEGTKTINDKLQKERAESILYVFQKLQADTIKSKVEVFTNWDLMFQQIETSKMLEDLKAKSKNEIASLLEDKNYALSIEDSLAKQRLAKVTFFIQYLPTPEKEAQDLIKQVKNIINKPNRTTSDLDTLKQNKFKIYKLVKEQKCDNSYIEKLEKAMYSNKYRSYSKDEYLMWLKYDLDYFKDPLNSEALYTEISKITMPSFEAQYNKINIAFNILNEDLHNRTIVIDSLYSDIEYLENIAQIGFEKKIDSMKLNFLISIFNYHYIEDDNIWELEIIEKYSNDLVDLAYKMELSEEHLLKIAKHLIFFKSTIQAANILQFLVSKNCKIEEVTTLYAKLIYQHHQEYNSTKYVEYLMYLQKKIKHKNLVFNVCWPMQHFFSSI